MDTTVSKIVGRQVWDSRARPTVEAEVHLAGGAVGRAIAPAGASRGSMEAIDLRDGGTPFGGWGVGNAVNNVNAAIQSVLCGMDAVDQAGVDQALIDLDSTPNKSKLGGNATVAVSLAVLQAAAAASEVPLWRYLAGGTTPRLPLPEIQIFGGGAHAHGRLDVQDFLIMAPNAQSFRQALEMSVDVYQSAGRILDETGRLSGTADEGGWWPDFDSNEHGLQLLVRAIEGAGYRPGEDIAISLDIAAQEFYRDGMYQLAAEQRELDRDGLIEMLMGWIDRYPLLSIEDPLAEDDHEGMQQLTQAVGSRVQIIGDDYLTTNAQRVRDAAKLQSCNAVLLKVNQAGTVTETKAARDSAREFSWGTVVSARSGESEDISIAHLAVGWDVGQLKVGSVARSERLAKWNEVLRIEEAMGREARFAGVDALPFAVTR